jgi:hypothetical protein
MIQNIRFVFEFVKILFIYHDDFLIMLRLAEIGYTVKGQTNPISQSVKAFLNEKELNKKWWPSVVAWSESTSNNYLSAFNDIVENINRQDLKRTEKADFLIRTFLEGIDRGLTLREIGGNLTQFLNEYCLDEISPYYVRLLTKHLNRDEFYDISPQFLQSLLENKERLHLSRLPESRRLTLWRMSKSALPTKHLRITCSNLDKFAHYLSQLMERNCSIYCNIPVHVSSHPELKSISELAMSWIEMIMERRDLVIYDDEKMRKKYHDFVWKERKCSRVS